jgi:hypothetical protein
MYSSAFCSVGLQAYNLKSPNLSLDEVPIVFRPNKICRDIKNYLGQR